MKKQKTTILKTNMREAFEAIPVPDEVTPLFKRVMNHLKSNAGVIHRKQLWYVTRAKGKKRGSRRKNRNRDIPADSTV